MPPSTKWGRSVASGAPRGPRFGAPRPPRPLQASAPRRRAAGGGGQDVGEVVDSRRGPGPRSAGRGRCRSARPRTARPGRPRCRAPARVSIASCWSATASHRLMPSAAGRGDAAGGQRGEQGVRRRAYSSRAPATVATVAGSVSRSTRTACRSRLDQPGPSSRRSATAVTTDAGPPIAASRRSGPWLLEKLRDVHGPVGQPVPEAHRRRGRDVARRGRPRSTMTPGWPARTPASAAAPAWRHAHPGRVVRPGLQEQGDRLAAGQGVGAARRARRPCSSTARRRRWRRPRRAGRAAAGRPGPPPARGRRSAPRRR